MDPASKGDAASVDQESKNSTYQERVSRIFGSLGTHGRSSDADNSEDKRLSGVHCSRAISKSRFCSSRYTPGYIRHPKKWTKYDLKEDGTEKMKGMSADQQNKAAALSFLKGRASSATDGDTRVVGGRTSEKVMFKRPKVHEWRRNMTHVQSSVHSHSSNNTNVHTMQEYDFGMKRQCKSKNQKVTYLPSVHLSHLEDDKITK